MAGDGEPHPSLLARILLDLQQRLGGSIGSIAGRGEGGSGLLESAFDGLAAFAERLRAVPSSSIADPHGDRVALVGTIVEIPCHFTPTPASVEDEVRFRLDGDPIGEVRACGAAHALLAYRATAPGVHLVTVELHPGTRLRSPHQVGSFQLQVLRGEPVVVVDADLLLEAPGPAVRRIRPRLDEGWALVIFDRAEPSRAEQIHAEAARLGLPKGAVLRPAGEAGLAQMGVDFTANFARTNLRRLIAAGVDVALVLTAHPVVAAAAREEGLAASARAEIEQHTHGGVQAARRRPPAEMDARGWLTWRLDVMSRSRAVAGNHCHIELDNRRARLELLRRIDEARATILFQVYIFEQSRFADQLCVSLIRAARAGVQVRLLVDALYSVEGVLWATNPMLAALRAERNIEVIAVDPIGVSQLALLRLKERDHRKMVVIDDAVAFVSGRNVGDHYYTGFDEAPIADSTPDERIPWLDAHVQLEGPLVGEVRAAFERSWRRNGGAPLPTACPAAAPVADGGATLRLVVHEGTHDNNAMGAYEAILDAATTRVIIVNDFPVVWTLAWAIRRALARGVQVDFLTGCASARRGDGQFFDGVIYRRLFEHFTKARLEPLIQEGVRVHELAVPELPNIVATGGPIRPYVHAKIMTADGVVASVGSANLDGTASYWEREANVVIEGGEVPRELERALSEMIARSLRIDLQSDYWRRDAALRGVVARLWPQAVFS